MWHLGENIEMWGCSVISGRTKSISLSLFKLPITIVIKKSGKMQSVIQIAGRNQEVFGNKEWV